jgi:hypothetical protein
MFTALLNDPSNWMAHSTKPPATLKPKQRHTRTTHGPALNGRKRRPSLPTS